MSRGLALFGMGVVLAQAYGLACAGDLDPPPISSIVACLVAPAAFGLAIVFHCIRAEIRRRRTFHAYVRDDETAATADRLLGDYPSYVVEAARTIASSGDPEGAPLVVEALRGVMRRKTPAWEEMAGAMVAALAELGDTRALSALHAIAASGDAPAIPELDSAIRSLARVGTLLRPAAAPADEAAVLLRPAGPGGNASDAEVLLRPSDG